MGRIKVFIDGRGQTVPDFLTRCIRSILASDVVEEEDIMAYSDKAIDCDELSSFVYVDDEGFEKFLRRRLVEIEDHKSLIQFITPRLEIVLPDFYRAAIMTIDMEALDYVCAWRLQLSSEGQSGVRKIKDDVSPSPSQFIVKKWIFSELGLGVDNNFYTTLMSEYIGKEFPCVQVIEI